MRGKGEIAKKINRYENLFGNAADEAKEGATSWDIWETSFEGSCVDVSKLVMSGGNEHKVMQDLGNLWGRSTDKERARCVAHICFCGHTMINLASDKFGRSRRKLSSWYDRLRTFFCK
eukprot:6983543-Ditylum_brightwellii.AAC.1